MTEDERDALELADTQPPEAAAEEPPLYLHDCPLCTFLGSATYGDRAFDLYYCKQGHLLPTVIARGSSQPHDYSSGMEAAKVDPVLREALERAKDRGLVPLDQELVAFEEVPDPFPP